VAWTFAHTTTSSASPAAVWRRYVDVEGWSEWSRQGVEWSRIDGPFEVGTTGTSKPPGLPAGRFRLVTVEPEARFVTETRLPGSRLRFEHVVTPEDPGSRIRHSAALEGPLAFVYLRVLRKRIERGLPDGVERLAVLAAQD
jgi:hypothetical protein